MMQQHTPGPWRNDYSPRTGFGRGYGKSQIIAATGQAIAGVVVVQPQAGPMYRGGGFSQETFDELEANARLIAAAPELLEACLAMTNLLQATIVKYVGNGTILTDPEWNRVGQARAAIAKATSP